MSPTGTIRIRHVPQGFFEPQIRKYFEQFGHVKKVKLFRSKKNARSKELAFVEFVNENVAKVAAESMNNYLMFEKILKCDFIPKDQLKAHTFKGWNRIFTPSRWPTISAHRHNGCKTDEKTEKLRSKMLTRLQKKNEKLASLGLDYQYKSSEMEQVANSQPKREHTTDQDTSCVMMVDEEDKEISFQTPPVPVRKVRYRYQQKSGGD